MSADLRVLPNVVAPKAGWYEEFDIEGRPTGVWVSSAEGEWLPNSPAGFSWREQPPQHAGSQAEVA